MSLDSGMRHEFCHRRIARTCLVPWLFEQVGRTERVENNLDPSFATPIKVTYLFEEVQKLEFRVYDIDDYSTHSLSDDDFLGSAETTLGLVS